MKKIISQICWVALIAFISISITFAKPEIKEINLKGNHYTLPTFVEIKHGNKTIFKDKKVRPWDKTDHTHYFQHGQYVFFKTNFNDGIDIDYSRLFIIKGDKATESEILTGNWADKFITTKKGKLYYWSEWFCDHSNDEIKTKGAYVYEFSSSEGTFHRKPVTITRQMDCKAEHVEKLLNALN